MGMRDENGNCSLCGERLWCGRPCVNDPKKQNALFFRKDGKERTLAQRGLGLAPGELDRRRDAMARAKGEGQEYDYREFAGREVERRPSEVKVAVALEAARITGSVTKLRRETKKDETEKVETKLITKKEGRGRKPKGDRAMTAYERLRAWRERKAKGDK